MDDIRNIKRLLELLTKRQMLLWVFVAISNLGWIIALARTF